MRTLFHVLLGFFTGGLWWLWLGVRYVTRKN